MAMALALLGGATVLAACTRSKRKHVVSPSPLPTTATQVDAAPLLMPMPPAEVRTGGPVRATIAPDRASVPAGEPLLLRLTIENLGDTELQFDVGGDWFGQNHPLRYGWEIRDDSGAVVCEVGKTLPGPMAGGGGGYLAKVAPGASHEEHLLLNPVCPAFKRPGRYRITLMRVLTRHEALPRDTPCDYLMVPDTTRLAPGAPDPHGRRDATCMAALLAAPAIAADFSLEIAPYDAAALRTRLATVPQEQIDAAKAGHNALEGAFSSYGTWFCDQVRCGCPDDILFQRVDGWLAKALAEVPATLPLSCP